MISKALDTAWCPWGSAYVPISRTLSWGPSLAALWQELNRFRGLQLGIIRLGIGRPVLDVLPLTGQRQLWANHILNFTFLLYKKVNSACLVCLRALWFNG